MMTVSDINTLCFLGFIILLLLAFTITVIWGIIHEIKEHKVILFVTIRAYGGRTYNSLSLLSVPEDEYKSQQTISGYFLHASEDRDDDILELIDGNIDAFEDMSDIDEEDVESLDMDIAACEAKKSFMIFYRVLLTKCPAKYILRTKAFWEKTLR